MDTLEFAKNIPPETMARIFRDYFEQHMAAYYMLKGVEFVSLNSVDINTSSIIYSVKILNEEQKEHLLKYLQKESIGLNIYGKQIMPDIYINGDLLCITISK